MKDIPVLRPFEVAVRSQSVSGGLLGLRLKKRHTALFVVHND
jgi:hypothetical protein